MASIIEKSASFFKDLKELTLPTLVLRLIMDLQIRLWQGLKKGCQSEEISL